MRDFGKGTIGPGNSLPSGVCETIAPNDEVLEVPSDWLSESKYWGEWSLSESRWTVTAHLGKRIGVTAYTSKESLESIIRHPQQVCEYADGDLEIRSAPLSEFCACARDLGLPYVCLFRSITDWEDIPW